MTYNSTLNKWKKANTYDIFLSAKRNCHFSQVRFTFNLLMPIFMLQLTTAQIIPQFHQHSSCWQNQLRQLLALQQCCFVTGDTPSASSTDVVQHQASKQQHYHFWGSCMGARQKSGTGRSGSNWLFWHMQWQWCTHTDRHKPPWMPWPWETQRSINVAIFDLNEQVATLDICICSHNKEFHYIIFRLH